jgi:hypothetical protein
MPLGRLPRRAQQESVRTGRVLAQQPVLAVVDARVTGDLGEVAADKREWVPLVGEPDPPDAFHGLLVPEVTTERIAGIRGINDHAAGAHDLGRAPDQADLRVFRVNFEQLCH